MSGHGTDMEAFESFKRQVSNALTHLYDPTYPLSDEMRTAMGLPSGQSVEAIQVALRSAVEALRPGPEVPATARSRRLFELLHLHYVRQLTQEETADQLGITPRHLRREQREAIDLLVRRLWGQRPVEMDGAVTKAPPSMRLSPSDLDPTKLPDWRSQVREELESLQKSAPNIVANVQEAVKGILDLERTLTAQSGIKLEAKDLEPGLHVTVHPSALRQILVTAIGRLVEHMNGGAITIDAHRSGRYVKMMVLGAPVEANDRLLDSALIREIVAWHGGAFAITQQDDGIALNVDLPSVDSVTVLVVDDNSDLFHFYRRYTTGTKYQLIHIAEGQRAFEAVKELDPDIVVLDVMLPDIDGWELLAELCRAPRTRPLPVIACSVVREKGLALSLGATLYLPKPVRRQQFLQALASALAPDLT